MDLKINYKNRITINIIISLILIIGITYFIIIPASKDIKKIKQQTEALRIDLEEKYIKGQSLRKLSESLKKIEKEIPKLDNIFIKKNEALKFVTSLENMSEETHTSQKINLVTDQAVKIKNYQKIPLHLFTNGTFSNQIEYLKKLESSNYYINIDSIEISVATRDTNLDQNYGNNDISISIFSNTYWLDN